MRKKTALTKRQIEVIEDFLTGELEERAVLEKHNVNPRLYVEWHSDEAFLEHLNKRIAAACRFNAGMIARSAQKAAKGLVKLAEEGTGETLRKACLDIIAMQEPQPTPTPPADPAARSPEHSKTITPEAAEKILEILAEEKDA